MKSSMLGADAVRRALCVRDLTDPAQGKHAIQSLVDAVVRALARSWGAEPRICRASPIVSVADNYDRLRYRPEAAARDARYTRYVCDGAVLRTQTSAIVPRALRDATSDGAQPRELLLACPGVVYRRDCIDRLHTGEPHQLDLWRVRTTATEGPPPLDVADLTQMIATVLDAALPRRAWRVVRAEHPYTLEGLQIDVEREGEWIEVGECGLAHPDVLREAGLQVHTGLAMGLGLDRLLMLRKGIEDIRLLRSTDARVQAQMLDLDAYKPVSAMPAVRRDLSIAVGAGVTAEELGDRVRAALRDRAEVIEEVAVIAETPYEAVPEQARSRLGLSPDQRNVLLRVVLRDLSRTLTHEEANALRDAVYAAVHEGPLTEWTRPT